MKKTITLDQAINKCPSIDCSMPSIDVSSKYRIISTKKVLEKAIDDGWRIFETYQVGNKITTQHFVLMTHDVVLNNDVVSKHGTPFICLVNSHNGKNSFKYVLGYYIYSLNTKIYTENAYMENCFVDHKKNDEDDAFLKLQQTKIYFRNFIDSLKTFDNKFLTKNETNIFELFCNKISNKKISIPYSEGDSLWKIANIVHRQLGKSIKTNMEFSQRFWKAMCCSLIFDEKNLNDFLLENYE
jgi:hypothetical protein